MTIRIRLNKPENALYYNKLVGSIIVMEFEDYVFGVVAAEIGNARMAACQAQAVAARTKALPYIHRGQPISDSSDTAQSFRATRMDAAKYPNAKAATDATAGEVLMYGKYVLDTCAYSANNGGRTTSSEARWGGYRAYLIEQNDPWDYAATGGKKTGHGVGMSQAGTKWAAAQGIGYADILAFYYPGAYLAPAYTKEGMYGMTNHE